MVGRDFHFWWSSAIFTPMAVLHLPTFSLQYVSMSLMFPLPCGAHIKAACGKNSSVTLIMWQIHCYHLSITVDGGVVFVSLNKRSLLMVFSQNNPFILHRHFICKVASVNAVSFFSVIITTILTLVSVFFHINNNTLYRALIHKARMQPPDLQPSSIPYVTHPVA